MKENEGGKKSNQNKTKSNSFLSFLGEASKLFDWRCNEGFSSTPLILNIQGARFYAAKQDLEAGTRWYIS